MKKILVQILKSLAKKILSKNPDLEIIGVTGSVGKSSAKEAIFAVLSNNKEFEGKVKRSVGNLNTEIGLPLAILGFDHQPTRLEWPFVLTSAFFRSYIFNSLSNISILVLEYSSDKPGDIKYLTSIIRPKIAVITKISAVHTKFFGDLDGVAKEKGKLAESLPKNGVLFLNKDDKYSKRISKRTKAEIKYFAEKSFNTAENIAREIGKHYKLSKDKIQSGLNKIKPLPRRLNIYKGLNKTVVIDDTYNANPESMKRALYFLEKYDKRGRKIAVLGDMLELGNLEKEAHQEIAKLAHRTADIFVAVGLKFQKTKSDVWFLDFAQAGNYLLRHLKKNDIILIKGSNAMKMDRIADKLRG